MVFAHVLPALALSTAAVPDEVKAGGPEPGGGARAAGGTRRARAGAEALRAAQRLRQDGATAPWCGQEQAQASMEPEWRHGTKAR
jgi:hypothetical protein